MEFFEPLGEQRAAILDQALDPMKNASITANDADGADANAAGSSNLSALGYPPSHHPVTEAGAPSL